MNLILRRVKLQDFKIKAAINSQVKIWISSMLMQMRKSNNLSQISKSTETDLTRLQSIIQIISIQTYFPYHKASLSSKMINSWAL